MGDITQLLRETPHDWLFVVKYKTGENVLFFTRIIGDSELKGYSIDTLMDNPALVINAPVTLDTLYTFNNDVEEFRVATDDEKSHIKRTLIESIEVAVNRPNGYFTNYNISAQEYIKALPL